MKRHPALVPLSHDHHHALVQARRLARAADNAEPDRLEAAERLLAFYAADTIEHFREEEEQLFPLVADRLEDPDGLLVRALIEHQRIHTLVRRLRQGVLSGSANAAVMRELAELLQAHVRLEERELFPLIESTLADESAAEVAIEPRDATAEPGVVDLISPSGTGPLWGTQSDDLNATLLAWPAGQGPGEHRNAERDVLLVVLAGQATVTLDGEEHLARAGYAILIEKGSTRSISAGPNGVRYLSIHRRRGPLQVKRSAGRAFRA
jgi:quercetin dioxygenase-like cupin family protein